MVLITITKRMVLMATQVSVYNKKSLLQLVSKNKQIYNRCQHSIAIVGSGPAGFYTAQQLLKVRCYLI